MMRSSRLSKIAIAVTLVLALALAGSALAAEKYKGFARGDALITPQELKTMMDKDDENLVILAVAKPTLQYRKGHIPGALNVWRPDYEPEVGNPWPYDGMILNKAEFQEFARNLGIDNDTTVVVYDHKYDATRVWWAFYLYGKKDVRVLDGGYDGWVAAGYDVDRIFAADPKKKGSFTASSPMPGWIAEIGDIWRAKTAADMHVWDTRGADEWTGAKVKGNSICGGRIPWAKQLNWPHFKQKVNEDAGNPTEFKTAADIQKVVDEFGIKEGDHHIFYCQSGVRTTTEIFALYLMGYDPATLHNYDGSWLEWSYHYCDQEANGRAIDRATLIEAQK